MYPLCKPCHTSVIPYHVYLWQFTKALEKKNTVVQEGKEGGDEQFIQSNVFSEIFEMQKGVKQGLTFIVQLLILVVVFL